MTVTVPQHLRALERANEVRFARADIKRQMKAGELTVAEVIAPGSELPLGAHSMRALELLMSQRRWGRGRSVDLLENLGIGERRRLETLTDRQRERIILALEGRLPQLADPVPVAPVAAVVEPPAPEPTGLEPIPELWESSEWLKGEVVTSWMKARGITGSFRGKTSVYRIDAVLTKRGRHLRELPEEAWLPPEPTKGTKPRGVRGAIVLSLDEGKPVTDIAREVGCSPGTVRCHRDKAQVAA